MKFEVWERWIAITGGAGTAFPCVQWHFNHWRGDSFSRAENTCDTIGGGFAGDSADASINFTWK